jgi:malonyl-CoA O-methyltransferase
LWHGAQSGCFGSARGIKSDGFDFSSAMLAEARKRDGDWTLFQADMSTPIALPDQSVDFVLFSLTLEHVADLVPPLQEARRLSRTGGVIKIVEIHPFLSLSGISAHFKTADGEEVTMPAFAHPFQDWLQPLIRWACASLALKNGKVAI